MYSLFQADAAAVCQVTGVPLTHHQAFPDDLDLQQLTGWGQGALAFPCLNLAPKLSRLFGPQYCSL